jgi:hypothetical protein
MAGFFPSDPRAVHELVSNKGIVRNGILMPHFSRAGEPKSLGPGPVVGWNWQFKGARLSVDDSK